MTTVAHFEIAYTQLIDPQGEATQPLPAFAREPAALIALYRAMVVARAFDAKAIALQRTGKIGTFASALGQEAVGVGAASAMRPDDILVPSYRDHPAQFVRGVTMVESLLYWGGDERGSGFAGPRHDFANCVPIATQVCHAVGAAYAFKLRREPRAAVCLLGDGGTSRGDFYEGLNMAGVWNVPMVLIVNNNQWGSRCRAACRARRRRWHRKRSPPGSRACRSMATTSSPSAMRPKKRWRRRVQAAGR